MRYLLISFALLTGCHHTSNVQSPVDVKEVISSQIEKDGVILAEAEKIDAIAPQAKQHTDRQREAVALAPASDVEKKLEELQEENSRLRDALVELKNASLQFQARGLTVAGFALLASFGIASIFGGGIVAMAKTAPLALMGVACFGLAQIISHPWFLPSMAGLISIVIGYCIWFVYDRHKEGRLKQSLSKKVRVLEQMIPILDDARENASDAFKELLNKNIFDKLSRSMTGEDKSIVHEIRAENKR